MSGRVREVAACVVGRRMLRRVLPVTALLAVGAAVVATAAIPDGAGVIHGCYMKHDGSLRVIDNHKGQTCGPNETPLNWNQSGRPGPPGPAGPSGVLAYAYVNGDGTLDKNDSSPGIVVTPVKGGYCLSGVPTGFHVAVASADEAIIDNKVFVVIAEVSIRREPGCDVIVSTVDSSDEGIPSPFSVIFS